MHLTAPSPKTSESAGYDPFAPGPFAVDVRTVQAPDAARNRVFPCEIWRPAAPGAHPLILYSHHSGGHRRASTFLCEHLASHGYVVAALDHSEVVAPELARREGETPEQLAARADAWVSNRVPDMRFLLDHMLRSETNLDPGRTGIVGHSLGGWTVLAAPEIEPRIQAVVALAPAGSSQPKPGIIRAKLTFDWGRDVPTLYLAAENDVPIHLDGIHELFERTRATKRLVILRRADHYHFMDNVEEVHETVRKTEFPGVLAWMSKEMRPIGELHSEAHAHLFVRALTLCHMDTVLKQQEQARRFLAGDIVAAMAARGVEVIVHKSA